MECQVWAFCLLMMSGLQRVANYTFHQLRILTVVFFNCFVESWLGACSAQSMQLLCRIDSASHSFASHCVQTQFTCRQEQLPDKGTLCRGIRRQEPYCDSTRSQQAALRALTRDKGGRMYQCRRSSCSGVFKSRRRNQVNLESRTEARARTNGVIKSWEWLGL